MLGFVSSKAFKELEDRVARLRRDLDDRDLDWVDMRSRCKRLLDRTEKAARVLTSSADHEEPAADGAADGHGRFLTPRQMEIQQQVLKRRGGA